MFNNVPDSIWFWVAAGEFGLLMLFFVCRFLHEGTEVDRRNKYLMFLNELSLYADQLQDRSDRKELKSILKHYGEEE
jgi:hypothetical protein